MVDYSETIEVYDVKVGIYSELNVILMSTWRDICTGGQCHSLTFVQGRSNFLNFIQLLP